MIVRGEWVQVVSTGVAAGATSVGLAALFNDGFKSENVFAFAGALLGASATVAGGAWIADRTTARERDRERSLIVPELDTLHTVADVASNTTPSAGRAVEWPHGWQSGVNALEDVSRGSDRFFEQVERFGKTLDFRQREAISDLRLAIREFRRFYADVLGEVDDLHPVDERTWHSVINPVVQAARDALSVFN